MITPLYKTYSWTFKQIRTGKIFWINHPTSRTLSKSFLRHRFCKKLQHMREEECAPTPKVETKYPHTDRRSLLHQIVMLTVTTYNLKHSKNLMYRLMCKNTSKARKVLTKASIVGFAIQHYSVEWWTDIKEKWYGLILVSVIHHNCFVLFLWELDELILTSGMKIPRIQPYTYNVHAASC
jgi:hypothetical protein